jgi:serine/threonine-protein kinase
VAEVEDAQEALIQTLGVDVTTLLTDDSGTIGGRHAQVGDVELDGDLPRLVLAGPDAPGDTAADLRLQNTIGTGATATVWAAAQSVLRRTVAVKQLRPERDTAAARAQLLQEARITGCLEHPNIVPVHTLGVSDNGSPLLVMKYVDGTPWRTSIRALYRGEEPPPPEQVEQQLRILLHVVSAVHFAHERGVLHRDLKPDNIMLGTRDEVYIVDWGLAVALDADVDLPLARDVSNVAGTPGYMAPEMVAAASEDLSCRTDVYLLGAILHELITGDCRHQGETTAERLAAAYRSEPFSYTAHVPLELASICNRACHRDPEQRHADAAMFREALEGFLRHRSSRELAEEADLRLERLRRATAKTAGGVEFSVDPATWNRWSTEARFGYRRALREWPDNEIARRGLQELIILLVRRELGRDNPSAAAELASELPEPAPSVLEEIAAAEKRVQAKDEDVAAAAAFRRGQDLGVSARWRRRAAYINGVTVLVGAVLLYAMRVTGLRTPGYPELMGFALIVAGVMAYGNRKIKSESGDNAINRSLVGGIVQVALAIALLFALGWLLDMDIVHAEVMAMLIAGTGGLTMAQSVDRNLIWTGLGFVVTAIAVALWPAQRGLIVAVGAMVSFSAGAWAWRKYDDTANG